MHEHTLVKEWDGNDIIGDIVVTILNTGKFILIQDHKTKTPEGKPARVSKKVKDGIYELLVDPIGRHLINRGEVLGIFPMNDSRNVFGTVRGSATKQQINEGILAIQQADGLGLLLKVVITDKIHPGKATVTLIKATEIKE